MCTPVLLLGVIFYADNEQVRSGIGRIREAMRDADPLAPEFKTEGMFTVVFKRTVEETVEKILNAIEENPKITAKEIQSYCHCYFKPLRSQRKRKEKKP